MAEETSDGDRRRGDYVVAGAVVGVLGVLATLFGLLILADNHFVTRREYDQVKLQLDRMERKLDALN